MTSPSSDANASQIGKVTRNQRAKQLFSEALPAHGEGRRVGQRRRELPGQGRFIITFMFQVGKLRHQEPE
jgi:hypothetical protein